MDLLRLNRDTASFAALTAGLVLLVWGPGVGSAGLGAALALGAAAARPLVGLGGVVASLPFYLFPRQLGGLAISPPEATLLLTTLAVALRGVWGLGFGGRRAGSFFPRLEPRTPSPYDAPIALFLVAALLSLLVTEYLRLSLRELRTLVVEPVVFFYLVWRLAGTVDAVGRLVDVLLAATTAVAVLAIGQAFFGGGVTEVEGVRRVQGTYTSPNHLGLLLGRVLPFVVAGAWLGQQRRPRLVAAALYLAALGLTFSLGAWLGTLAAFFVLAALLGGRRLLAQTAGGVAIIATVALLAVVAIPALRVERLAARLDPSRGTTVVRIQLWRASAELIAEQPLLGIGLDNFLYRYPARVPPDAEMEPNLSHPHNLVLQFWLQLGLAGLAALGWLLAMFLRRALPAARATGPAPARALAAGALASMTDFVAHGLVDNSYFLVDTAFIFWLTLAAVGRLPTHRDDSVT